MSYMNPAIGIVLMSLNKIIAAPMYSNFKYTEVMTCTYSGVNLALIRIVNN